MGTVHLNGHSLTLDDVIKVARCGYKVDLDPAAKAFVKRGASAVEEWVKEGKIVYGITTGFGDLASVTIPPEQSEILQENLLKSHASGVGEPFAEDVVRAIMLLRINTLIRGFSGITLETLSLLVDLLNNGIHPVIPSQGSVGASGDLCPLSHLALALLGLSDVFYRGQRMPAAEALEQACLKPVKLKPKEGLALNNGTAATTAIASLVLYDALNLSKTADIAGAMSLEALHGVPYAFDSRTHDLRPHFGQRSSASNIRRLIEGSEIVEAFRGSRVQDAYSLRCIPQVHGASRDALDFVRQKIDIEINSVTDNPLIFPADGEALSGGNFHAQPIALAMDFLGIAVAELACISERRVARLIDHKLSGLPAFLMESRYRKWKEWVRSEIDQPMLRRVAPLGCVIRDLRIEEKVGKLAFGRQLATYPLLVGVVDETLPVGAVLTVAVTDYGRRSITGVPFPLDINNCPLSSLTAIPGIGKARATRIAQKRPYASLEKLKEAVDDEIILNVLELFCAL
jgi:histidine ammonia-lyase